MPVAPRVADDVAEFAGQLLFRLWRASNARTTQALATIDLTPALFALLNVLGARDGVIQQQLSADMEIDPSAMVGLIDDLESRGLVSRRRRQSDRRAWEITITSQGRRMLKRARDLAKTVEAETLEGLNPSERDDLLVLLRRALGATPPQAPWQPGAETGPS